jgi:hypothetical protein
MNVDLLFPTLLDISRRIAVSGCFIDPDGFVRDLVAIFDILFLTGLGFGFVLGQLWPLIRYGFRLLRGRFLARG